MKTHILVASALLLTVAACQKTVTQTEQQSRGQGSNRPAAGIHDSTPPVVDSSTIHPPFPQSPPPSSGCSLLPIYGDTIIFPQPTSGQDYIFNVVNNPGTGKYFSWPQGMVM